MKMSIFQEIQIVSIVYISFSKNTEKTLFSHCYIQLLSTFFPLQASRFHHIWGVAVDLRWNTIASPTAPTIYSKLDS